METVLAAFIVIFVIVFAALSLSAAGARLAGMPRRLEPDPELSRRLADGPTLAYAETKSLITRELDMSLAAAVELDASTQALLMTTQDHTEFHAAFNARRPPQWTGR